MGKWPINTFDGKQVAQRQQQQRLLQQQQHQHQQPMANGPSKESQVKGAQSPANVAKVNGVCSEVRKFECESE